MSAPKFIVSEIDLDDMSVKHIGYINDIDALKHPKGWVFVFLPDGVYMRTDQNPLWVKVNDARPKSIEFRSSTD